jgi:hypothetical protein
VIDPELSDRCILIESSSARDILTDHFLIGSPLITKSKNAVKDSLAVFFALHPEILKQLPITEVVPLSGSLTYDLLNAFYERYKQSISRSFVGIKRFQKPDGRWESHVSYTNFEALAEAPKTIFIGDTIATGATMSKVIEMVQVHLQIPLKFVIISIAGSLLGAKRIVQLEQSLQSSFPGTSIWCLFTEAFFGLEDNGTDMPVLHPNTICTPQLREKTINKLGMYLGRNLCSVLDWGKRTNAPTKHYHELFEVLRFLRAKDDKNQHIDDMMSKCQEFFPNSPL